MYYTYVLLSEKDQDFYIGFTKDFKQRLEKHQSGLVSSTTHRRPLKLIYYEACLNKQDATKRDSYFKSGFGRRFLRNRLQAFLQEEKWARLAMAGADDSYLLAASLYIHQNPVRAGLATEPINYRWSSCRLYCKDGAPKSFIDSDFILRLFPKGEVTSKERYRRLLKQGGELETGQVLEQEDAIERFRSKLTTMFPSLFKRLARKKQIAGFSGIDLLDIEELEKQIEAVRTGQFSDKPESKKAKKHLIEQLIARGYKREEIAERLGVSRKTVYNILKSST